MCEIPMMAIEVVILNMSVISFPKFISSVFIPPRPVVSIVQQLLLPANILPTACYSGI